MGETTARTIRVDDELWAAAAQRAAELGSSVSEVIRIGLQQFAGDRAEFQRVTIAMAQSELLPANWSEDFAGRLYVTYPALRDAMRLYAAER